MRGSNCLAKPLMPMPQPEARGETFKDGIGRFVARHPIAGAWSELCRLTETSQAAADLRGAVRDVSRIWVRIACSMRLSAFSASAARASAARAHSSAADD